MDIEMKEGRWRANAILSFRCGQGGTTGPTATSIRDMEREVERSVPYLPDPSRVTQ
jgi:hypothetical protein